MWSYWKNKSWNNRKIAFVSILIATSVAFVLIFTKIIPITTIPSFKIMAGGLPVKLTGYIFGPLIGALTGFLSDMISFLMMPTFIHWWYSLAFAMAGAVPGIVGYFMHRRWKYKGASNPDDETKYNNTNFFITLGILAAVITAISIFIVLQKDSVFANQKLIKNRWAFLGISVAGSSTMFIAVLLFRVFLKPKTFNSMLPIIAFSALIEIINTPLTALGDMQTLIESNDDFLTILTAHFLTSPVKIWGNLLVIFFAYRIVAPLIFNKTGNGWNAQRKLKKQQKKQKGAK